VQAAPPPGAEPAIHYRLVFVRTGRDSVRSSQSCWSEELFWMLASVWMSVLIYNAGIILA